MNSSDNYSDMNSSEVDFPGSESWSPPPKHMSGGKKVQSMFMNDILKSLQRDKVNKTGSGLSSHPSLDNSMFAVLFQNQLEIAKGMRCVIRVPKQPIEPTKWSMLCEAMAPVDEVARPERQVQILDLL